MPGVMLLLATRPLPILDLHLLNKSTANLLTYTVVTPGNIVQIAGWGLTALEFIRTFCLCQI